MASCKLIAFDYGYKKPFAFRNMCNWTREIDIEIEEGKVKSADNPFMIVKKKQKNTWMK